MSNRWTEFYRRMNAWQRDDDDERLQMIWWYYEANQYAETDIEQTFAILTKARDEARRLEEPWWVLFFESWRLNALTSHAMDFARALPLAMELMVTFNTPENREHQDRNMVLDNVLYTYINIDPFGYQPEIERGIAYLRTQVLPEECFVLNHREMSYLSATGRFDEAHALGLKTLGMVDRVQDPNTKHWHGAWMLYQLCRISLAQGNLDQLTGYVAHMEEHAVPHQNLDRVRADICFWKALLAQREGSEKQAASLCQRGLRLLSALTRRDTVSSDPMVAYLTACNDLTEAIAVRDRELVQVTMNGQLHRACEVLLDRCKLLKQQGNLTPGDLDRVRDAASKLRIPAKILTRLREFETQ